MDKTPIRCYHMLPAAPPMHPSAELRGRFYLTRP